MPTNKHVRQAAWRAATVGVAVDALSYLGTRLPLPPGQVTDLVTEASTYGYAVGTLTLATAVGHRIWSHTRTAQRRTVFHGEGWASRHDFADVLGEKGVRRVADQVRPSLATRAHRAGYKPTATDYAQYMGKAVTGTPGVRGNRVYVSFETCVIIIAPPGKGKTALMLHPLLDAPGSTVVASTKADVYQLTAELRGERGPVHLFNPKGVGGIAGNFRWDPLIGCEDYQAAVDRATALVKGTKAITAMAEASWGEKCVEILSKYLMAARLSGQNMSVVASWLSHDSNEEAVRILTHFSPQYVPEGWAAALQAEMRSEADRMKGSIWSLARGAVAFMSNPVIAAACSPGAGELFDVREFARSGRSSLYLLGDDKDETIAPLLNALVNYVYDGAKVEAESTVTGRLDPPLGFFLDEVAKITPVPLADWAADCRGYGMYITAVTQSFDQLRGRYGKDGSGAIETLFAKVIMGGIQNMSDLQNLTNLVGPRWTKVRSESTSTHERGGRSHSKNTNPIEEDVMPPAEIRMLPRGHALILNGEARAVVVKFTKGQTRAERALKKLHRAKARSATKTARATRDNGPGTGSGIPDPTVAPPAEYGGPHAVPAHQTGAR